MQSQIEKLESGYSDYNALMLYAATDIAHTYSNIWTRIIEKITETA
jgi:hypothetical protein